MANLQFGVHTKVLNDWNLSMEVRFKRIKSAAALPFVWLGYVFLHLILPIN
jgi:hypothetical protein